MVKKIIVTYRLLSEINFNSIETHPSDLTSIDPDTDEIVRLYHPRKDNWHKHFQLEDAQFVPLTPIGRATVRLLQLNRSDRIEERTLLIKADILNLPPEHTTND
jgi:hypothetical protein